MLSWPREENSDILVKILLFLLSPVLGFIYSLRTMNRKSSYVIFFLFAVVFGFSFTVSSVRDLVNSIDGVHYRNLFETYQNVDLSYFLEGLKNYLSFKEIGSKDYYFDTISFLVSRISDNYHVLFMVSAIIFAYFSLKSFRFFTSENNFKVSFACFLLAYLFMINQIFNINGMRFWTASWVAVYSILQIFRNGNLRYLILAFITPFIHVSFWAFLIVLMFALLFKKFHKVWIVLFLISFFASTISIEFIQSLSIYLPPVFSDMVESYTNLDYIDYREKVMRDSNYAIILNFLINLFLNFIVWLFIKNSKSILNNPSTSNLYQFLLVWMTFVNFTRPIPSFGSRFIMLSYPLISYIWLVHFSGKKYQKLLLLIPFIFSLQIYQQLLLYNFVLKPEFYFASPLYLFFKYIII